MSKKDAMIKYIKGVEKIKSGWLSWKGLEGEKAVNFALRAIHFKFSPENRDFFWIASLSASCSQIWYHGRP
jgi:hypothetical protein